LKQFLIILFLTHFNNLFGQFAIVSDTDGFLNVRQDGQHNSTIVDKLQNGHLIYCFDKKGNWTNIDYIKKEKELNGYVYQNRYTLVSDFPKITITSKTENKVILKNEVIQVTISQSKFDKKRHNFKYVKEYPNQIELIDNKKYWGRDGGMPKTQFDKIEIKTEQKITTLPKAALEGLYEPSIYSAEVNYDKINDILYIYTMNSDGAGTYFVIWKIQNGIYKDRLIAYRF
jgi:hypothetical protein